MGRTIKNNHMRRPKPVQKIELSERNVRQRGILLILLLFIAGGAFLYTLLSYLRVDSGWKEIEAGSAELNCGDEFTFLYCLGQEGRSATAENKAVTAIYTEAAEKAYRLFHNDQSFEGEINLYEINHHPNEVLEVDEVLYRAFALFQEYDSRYLYLAPIYMDYRNLFSCIDDGETVSFDPYQNEEVAGEFAQIAAYARDPKSVDMELLGDNRVRLKVSEEYASYAKECGFESFVDFFWMKNAFVADYLAGTLREAGYTRGTISSYDGFIRNLDESGTSYSFDLYDRVGMHVYPAGVMRYSSSMSIVFLRDYGISDLDGQHYYEFRDGEIRTAYVDVKDGFSKSTQDNLVSYSREKSCAEILLEVLPIYIADGWDADALWELGENGIFSVYGEDFVLRYNEEALTITDLYEKEGVRYTTSLVSGVEEEEKEETSK